MMRRILVGAAIAGAVFGFSVTGATADVGPNPSAGGVQVLSQFSALDDLTALNGVLNGAASYSDILGLGLIVPVLSNVH